MTDMYYPIYPQGMYECLMQVMRKRAQAAPSSPAPTHTLRRHTGRHASVDWPADPGQKPHRS